jgi:DUF4097 and DUF4098 domain-containing protein YvlB
VLERVRITTTSGRLHITGEARDDLDAGGTAVGGTAAEPSIAGRSDRLSIRVPTSAAVIAGTSSGNVAVDGTVGPISITTSSASVEAEDVASIDARTTSGKVRVGHCRGPLRLRTKSSTVRVDRVDGETDVTTVSGKIEIADARGPVTVRTVSGTIEISVDGSAPVVAETVSGSIRVRVPGDRHPQVRDQQVSGRTRVDVEQGDDFTISVRSVSGKVTVVRR